MEPVIVINPGRFCVCDVCFKHETWNRLANIAPSSALFIYLVLYCVFFFFFFLPGASKWDIRQKVWDFIEGKNLANFPRPVHNRIPNFKASTRGTIRAAVLPLMIGNIEINRRKAKQQKLFLEKSTRMLYYKAQLLHSQTNIFDEESMLPLHWWSISWIHMMNSVVFCMLVIHQTEAKTGEVSAMMMTTALHLQNNFFFFLEHRINGCLFSWVFVPHLLCDYWPGCRSGMQQACKPPGVQVQPDSQSQPRQATTAGSLCHSRSKCFELSK